MWRLSVWFAIAASGFIIVTIFLISSYYAIAALATAFIGAFLAAAVTIIDYSNQRTYKNIFYVLAGISGIFTVTALFLF